MSDTMTGDYLGGQVKKTAITAVAAAAIVAIAATSAWAWTTVMNPNNTLWPIRKVENVRQLTHNLPNTEYKLRSDCFIGVNPLKTEVEVAPLDADSWWASNKASVITAAHIACREPDLSFTRIEWTFALREITKRHADSQYNQYTTIDQLSDSRTFDQPKQYANGVVTLGEFSFPCRTISPGKAGTPTRIWTIFELRLWDTEGRDWYKSVEDIDTIICPRNP